MALLTLPALPFVLPSLGVDPNDLKYYTGCASIAFGMLVLTVCLLRRQRERAQDRGLGRGLGDSRGRRAEL